MTDRVKQSIDFADLGISVHRDPDIELPSFHRADVYDYDMKKALHALIELHANSPDGVDIVVPATPEDVYVIRLTREASLRLIRSLLEWREGK